jgi:hypothetical protein
MEFRYFSLRAMVGCVFASLLASSLSLARAEESATTTSEIDNLEPATDSTSDTKDDTEDSSADNEQKADSNAPLLLEVPDAASSKPLPSLSPDQIKLRDRLRKVLANYYPKHLDSQSKSCWEVMHGIIAYGVDAKLFRSAPGSQKVNAIGWMCYNQPCHGEQLFYLDRGGLVARRGPGLQGHLGQFLAIVAQSHVPADFPMQVGGKKFTLQDLIEHEKSDCRAGEELTFKLIGLSHYLDSDAEWTTKDGQKWNISRLIREELKQPILRVAACGGNHRLMGHSYAIYKRRKQGKPIDGQFARAEKFIADYNRYAYSLQNSDGSFSTRWFEGREARPDIDRRLKTTGHTFEWMAFSVPEDHLRNPKMVKAANYLINLLESHSGHQWEVGPQGHALHALRIYDRRLFKPHDAAPTITPTEIPLEVPTAQNELEPQSTKPLEMAQKPKTEKTAEKSDETTSNKSVEKSSEKPAVKPNASAKPTAPTPPPRESKKTAVKPATPSPPAEETSPDDVPPIELITR